MSKIGTYYDLEPEQQKEWDKKLVKKDFEGVAVVGQQLQFFMDKIRPSCLTEADRTDALMYINLMQLLEEIAKGSIVFINEKEFRAIEAQSIEYFKLHKITCELEMEEKDDDL